MPNLIILVISLFLSGCLFNPKEKPKYYFHNLKYEIKEEKLASKDILKNKNNEHITVLNIEYDLDPAKIYINTKGKIDSYKKNYWQKHPGSMVQDTIAEVLTKSKMFGQVTVTAFKREADYYLYVSLSNLTNTINDNPSAKIKCFVSLYSNKTNKVIWSDSISIAQKSKSSDINEIILAYKKANFELSKYILENISKIDLNL
jgi:ABC-type uncharacterized transport system auxiliary subunit